VPSGEDPARSLPLLRQGRRFLDSYLESGIGLTVAMQSFNMLDQLVPEGSFGPVGEIRLVPDLETFAVLLSLPFSRSRYLGTGCGPWSWASDPTDTQRGPPWASRGATEEWVPTHRGARTDRRRQRGRDSPQTGAYAARRP
jgi:hypothetical protein